MRVSSWLKRPWLWVCTIVLVSGVAAFALSGSVRYVVIMTIASVTYGITTARDVDKAAALQQAVVSKTKAIHRFVRDSMNYPDRPPISVNPGSEQFSLNRQRLLCTTSRTEPSRIKSLPQCKL